MRVTFAGVRGLTDDDPALECYSWTVRGTREDTMSVEMNVRVPVSLYGVRSP
jgi:hypothetical protein